MNRLYSISVTTCGCCFLRVINALALGEGDSGFVDRMHVDQNLAEKAVDAAGVFQDECYLGENPVMLLVKTNVIRSNEAIWFHYI